jgi:hypothetical protein
MSEALMGLTLDDQRHFPLFATARKAFAPGLAKRALQLLMLGFLSNSS